MRNFFKFLAVIACCCMGSSGTAEAEDPIAIKIGAILPLTGDFSFFGEQARQGMTIAADELNASGKYKIEIVFEDDKCLPKFAVSAYTKLTSIDKVDVIIGPACTGSILSVEPIAKKGRTDVLALLDAGQGIRSAGKRLFALGYETEEMGYIVAEHLHAQGIGTAGVISETDAWAQLVKTSFVKRYTELGGKVSADESQNLDNKDYRPNILKAIKGKPQAIYFVPAYNGGHFMKQLRELQIELPVFGPDTFGVQEVLDIAKDAAEGVVYVNVLVDEQSPAAKKLRAELRSKFNVNPESLLYTALGYDGVRILSRTVKAGGELDKNLSELRYTDGIIPVNGFDQDGIAKLTLTLMKISSQKFVPVK